ncbi:uncharacterized protein KNAG_0J00110 [Huiozyma naganishii CBS 8797]|uniref:Hyphally-regulated cell wall protein N-terminal domain-containing protein n=1 Tax=Huiozyma naganishii (strain ATCC MYA-139 / BCRC 22969 / CBS 8797 / KCTC 17520 / NBRC 10181 / NCYC 3082 / Yp74L-3) TaxID=1071383 RepID=J7S9G4_HUIN7|nr:hypothetical protein KNAG_0J00110 [Kazachstania naganishii CBS 8797]CCK72094.1 hypothetical protein KNAG_0J00110 [Kazachstania naganishii CBS 8797]
MFFTSFYNSGSIYVKGSAAVQPAVTFEGLEVFINDGTIDAGSRDEGPAHSAIAFGDAFDPKKTPFINHGKVVVSGTEKFIEGNVVYLLAGNAVSFYAPVEGTGSVEVTNSYIGLNAETNAGGPEIQLKDSALYLPANFSTSISVRGLKGSIVAFSLTPTSLLPDMKTTLQDGKLSIGFPDAVATIADIDGTIVPCGIKQDLFTLRATESIYITNPGISFTDSFPSIPDPVTTTTVVGEGHTVTQTTSYYTEAAGGTCEMKTTVYPTASTLSTRYSAAPSAN